MVRQEHLCLPSLSIAQTLLTAAEVVFHQDAISDMDHIGFLKSTEVVCHDKK